MKKLFLALLMSTMAFSGGLVADDAFDASDGSTSVSPTVAGLTIVGLTAIGLAVQHGKKTNGHNHDHSH